MEGRYQTQDCTLSCQTLIRQRRGKIKRIVLQLLSFFFLNSVAVLWKRKRLIQKLWWKHAIYNNKKKETKKKENVHTTIGRFFFYLLALPSPEKALFCCT